MRCDAVRCGEVRLLFFVVPDYFPNISFHLQKLVLYSYSAANCATKLFKIKIRWLFVRVKPQANALSFEWISDLVDAFFSFFVYLLFFAFFFGSVCRYLTRSFPGPILSGCFLNHLNTRAFIFRLPFFFCNKAANIFFIRPNHAFCEASKPNLKCPVVLYFGASRNIENGQRKVRQNDLTTSCERKLS